MKKFVLKALVSQVVIYSALVFAWAEHWSEVSLVTGFIVVLGAACGVGVVITCLTVAHENGWRDRDQVPLGRRTEEILDRLAALFHSRRRLIYVSGVLASILGGAGLSVYMYPAIQIQEGKGLILTLIVLGGGYAGIAVPGWILLAAAWRKENDKMGGEAVSER